MVECMMCDDPITVDQKFHSIPNPFNERKRLRIHDSCTLDLLGRWADEVCTDEDGEE